MSVPNYPEILDRRYPNLVWTMIGNDYDSLTMISGAKPLQADLDAYWPGVESEINSEQDVTSKAVLFQRNYSIQTQLIECMRAISTGDKTTINSILSTWDNL